MSTLTDFPNFVSEIEASSYYKKWAITYSSDATAWIAWRTALLAGQRPPAPTSTSHFGKALINAGLLYLDIVAPPPPPPPAAYPPTNFAVHHFWAGMDATDSFLYSTESKKMDDLVVHAADSWSRGINFLTYQPKGHALVYQNFGNAGDGVATALDITTARSKGWLATHNGAEITNPWGGNTLVVDVGKTGVREAYVAAIRGKTNYSAWSGVFADDVNEWNNLWSMGKPIDGYSSPDDFWARAMLPLISYVAQQLGTQNKTLIPNVGDLTGYPLLRNAVNATSGIHCEFFLAWGDGSLMPPIGVENAYAALRACVTAGKVFFGITHRNSQGGAVYGFCAAAIMAGDSPSSLRLAVQNEYGSAPLLWDPIYETALGAPTGPVVHTTGSENWSRAFGSKTVSINTATQTGSIT